MEPTPSSAAVGSSAKSISHYLKAVKELLDRAGESRQLWIRQIGKVGQAIKAGDEMAAVEAGVVGGDQAERFRKIREELAALTVPAACDSCQIAAVSWLEKQIAACEVMVEIGQTRNVDLMRHVSGMLAEGRIDTARFKAEYNGLVTALQQRLKTTRPAKTGRTRWPFGTKPRKAGLKNL